MEINDRVRGIAHNKNVAKITVLGVPDQPGIAAVIFEPLSDAGISVDTIVQNSGIENLADLTFTVSSGVITATSGGTLYRLLTESLPTGASLSLASSGMFNTFNNISVDIYLYALCSVLGPELTIVKS